MPAVMSCRHRTWSTSPHSSFPFPDTRLKALLRWLWRCAGTVPQGSQGAAVLLAAQVLGRRRKEMLLEEYTGVPDAGTEKQPAQPKWAMKVLRHESGSAVRCAVSHPAALRDHALHARLVTVPGRHSM